MRKHLRDSGVAGDLPGIVALYAGLRFGKKPTTKSCLAVSKQAARAAGGQVFRDKLARASK